MKYFAKLFIILTALFMVGCSSSSDKRTTTDSANTVSRDNKVHEGYWTPYANHKGKSNILSYRTGDDYIEVQFKSGHKTIYRYSYSSAGKDKVEEMKRLASNGQGLNSYINKNVKELYER